MNIDRIFPPQYRQSVGISCYSVNIFKEDSGHRRASQTLCRRLETVNVNTKKNSEEQLRKFEIRYWPKRIWSCLFLTSNDIELTRKKSRHSLIPFAAWSKRAGFEYKKKKVGSQEQVRAYLAWKREKLYIDIFYKNSNRKNKSKQSCVF